MSDAVTMDDALEAATWDTMEVIQWYDNEESLYRYVGSDYDADTLRDAFVNAYPASAIPEGSRVDVSEVDWQLVADYCEADEDGYSGVSESAYPGDTEGSM